MYYLSIQRLLKESCYNVPAPFLRDRFRIVAHSLLCSFNIYHYLKFQLNCKSSLEVLLRYYLHQNDRNYFNLNYVFIQHCQNEVTFFKFLYFNVGNLILSEKFLKYGLFHSRCCLRQSNVKAPVRLWE